jgi:uncharacterized membrane protein YccC
MAVDFPGCHFLGVDVAPLQPTTVLPQNCSFELINVLKGKYKDIVTLSPFLIQRLLQESLNQMVGLIMCVNV